MYDFYNNLKKQYKINGIIYTLRYLNKIFQHFFQCNPFYYESQTPYFFRGLLKLRKNFFLLKIKLAQQGIIPLVSSLQLYKTRVNRIHTDIASLSLFAHSWQFPSTQIGIDLDAYFFDLLNGFKVGLYFMQSILVFSIYPMLNFLMYFRRSLDFYFSSFYAFILKSMYRGITLLNTVYFVYIFFNFYKIIKMEKNVALKFRASNVAEFYEFGWVAGLNYTLYYLTPIFIFFSWLTQPLLIFVTSCLNQVYNFLEFLFYYFKNLLFYFYAVSIIAYAYVYKLFNKIYSKSNLLRFFYYINFFRKIYFPVLYPYFIKYPSFISFVIFTGTRLFFLFLPLLFVFCFSFYFEVFDYVWTVSKTSIDSNKFLTWNLVSGIQLDTFLTYFYLPLWFFYTLGIKITYFAQLSPIHLVAFLLLYYIVVFYIFDYTYNSTNSIKIYFSELTSVDLNDRFKKIIANLNLKTKSIDDQANEIIAVNKTINDYKSIDFEENSTAFLDLSYTNQNLLIKIEGLEHYYFALSSYFSAFSVAFPLTAFTFSALDTDNIIEEEFFEKFSSVIVSDLSFDEIEDFDIFNNYLLDYDYNEEFDTVSSWLRFGEESMEDEPMYHVPDNLDYNEFSCFPEFFYDEALYDLYLYTIRNFLLPYYYYLALNFVNRTAAITTHAQLKSVQSIIDIGKSISPHPAISENELDGLLATIDSLPQQNLSQLARRDMLTESVFALINFDMQDKLIYYHYDLKLGKSGKYVENFYYPDEILEEEFSREKRIKIFDALPDYIKYSSFHYFLENIHEPDAEDIHTLDTVFDLAKTIGYDPFYGFYEFLEEDDQPRSLYELRVGQNIEYFPELDEYPIERHLPLHMYNMEFFEFDIDAPTNGAFYPEVDLSDFSNSGFVKKLSDPESYRWAENSALAGFDFEPNFMNYSKDYAKLFLTSGLARYAEVFSYIKPACNSFSNKQYDFFAHASVINPDIFLIDSILHFGSADVNNWSQQLYKNVYAQYRELTNLDFDTFPYFTSDVMLLEMEDFRDAATSNINPRIEFNQLKFFAKKDVESDFQFILDNDGFDTYVFNAENEEVGSELPYAEPIIFRHLLNKTPTRWYRQVIAYVFFIFLNLSAYFKWILPFQTLWFGKTLNMQTKQLFDRARMRNDQSIYFGEVAQSIWYKGDSISAEHYYQLKPKILRDPKFRNSYYNYVLGDGFRPLDEWLQAPVKLPTPAVSWLQYRVEYLIVFIICYFILELIVDFFVLKLEDWTIVKRINKIFSIPRLFKNPINDRQYILWSPTNPYYVVFLKKLNSIKNISARYSDLDAKYFSLFFNHAVKNAFRLNSMTYANKLSRDPGTHSSSLFDKIGYTFNDTSISIERSHIDFYDPDLALIPDSEYYDIQIPTDYMDFYEDTARFEKFPYYHSLDAQNFVLFNFNPIRFWNKHAILAKNYFGIVPLSFEQFFFTYYLNVHTRERRYLQRLIFKLTTLRDYKAIWYNLQVSRGFFYFNLPNSYFIYPYFSFQKFFSSYRTTKKYKQGLNNLPVEETGLEFVGIPGLDTSLNPTTIKIKNNKKEKMKTLLNLKSMNTMLPSNEIQINILNFYFERGGYLNCYAKERPYFEHVLSQAGVEYTKESDRLVVSANKTVLTYNKKAWLRFYPYLSVYNFYGYTKVTSRFMFKRNAQIDFKWNTLTKSIKNLKNKNDI